MTNSIRLMFYLEVFRILFTNRFLGLENQSGMNPNGEIRSKQKQPWMRLNRGREKNTTRFIITILKYSLQKTIFRVRSGLCRRRRPVTEDVNFCGKIVGRRWPAYDILVESNVDLTSRAIRTESKACRLCQSPREHVMNLSRAWNFENPSIL